ncbi:MAG: sensor histidine kinase [Lachnospiraceae bacterium]
MKLTLRFAIFFFLGLFFFVIGMGLFVTLFLEVVFPLIGKPYWIDNSLLVVIVIFIPFLACGFLFSLYFVAPMVKMLYIINSLSIGNYDLSDLENEIYNRQGKLKIRYKLYKEVINDLHGLANNLLKSQNDRIELETAKQSWISGISHDLKTPLTYIKGYAALLMNNGHANTPEEQKQFSEEIYNKSIYFTELLEDINLSFKMDDLGKELPLNRMQFDLIEFAREITADVANDPRASDYDLGFQCQGEKISVCADPKLLRRAVLNLIMNAIQHNPIETEVMVELQAVGDTAIIEVKDNGQGMSPLVHKRIFERYFREKQSNDFNFSGGVGLAVVKGIVEAHNGSVECDSVEGIGSTFRVSIPGTFEKLLLELEA